MIIKTAGASVISATSQTQDLDTLGIKSAAIIEKVDPDMVYSVVRGIDGNVFNENHDMWGWEGELMKKRADSLHTYQTWEGKPVCIQHKNTSPLDHFGKVLSCWPNHEQQSVYMLLATDKTLNPDLAKRIERGIINKVSMGCAVAWSNCTVCGSTAYRESDYCDHLKFQKGQLLPVDSSMNYNKSACIGTRVRVGEDCHDSTGQEMSWVANPAFVNAVSIETFKTAETQRPNVSDQYTIVSKILQSSLRPDDVKAGVLIEKVASKGYLTPDELDKVSEMITLLGYA